MRLDPEKIGRALVIAPATAIQEFQDARVASRFAEHWAAALFGYLKHKDTNAPGSDGTAYFGAFGPHKVSHKCLSKAGVKFQRSSFVGSGRECTKEDLIQSIAEVDYFCICDIRSFPELKMLSIKTRLVRRWIDDGKLTPSGLSPRRFYELLGETGILEEKEVPADVLADFEGSRSPEAPAQEASQ